MSKITWDETGKRFYETGVDRGVLYIQDSNGEYPFGVPWNGLISVSENPTGGEPEAVYSDNIKYLNLPSIEELEGSIEAYSCPREWMKCDGCGEITEGVYIGQQRRSTFGLSYRTLIGNDTEGTSHGYKIHLLYGCLASPSEKTYQTINDSPEAITFSWDFSTTPVNFTGYKQISEMIIDSTKIESASLAVLEDVLYGTDNTDPHLPYPDDLVFIAQSVTVGYDSRTGNLYINSNSIETEYNATTGDLTIASGHYTYNTADNTPVANRPAGNLEIY